MALCSCELAVIPLPRTRIDYCIFNDELVCAFDGGALESDEEVYLAVVH